MDVFTGIIEETGQVTDLHRDGDSALLRVLAQRVLTDLARGASVAVNGACLTVVDWDVASVAFDVIGETLERTAIGSLRPGTAVNLERAVPAGARLDGHVVQGHVDGTGTVLSRTGAGQWDTVRFGLPSGLARFVAEKGSITVDGVSLTVSAVGPDWFEVGLIPETLRVTTLGHRATGDRVNLEVDVLAKYVARLLEFS